MADFLPYLPLVELYAAASVVAMVGILFLYNLSLKALQNRSLLYVALYVVSLLTTGVLYVIVLQLRWGWILGITASLLVILTGTWRQFHRSLGMIVCMVTLIIAMPLGCGLLGYTAMQRRVAADKASLAAAASTLGAWQDEQKAQTQQLAATVTASALSTACASFTACLMVNEHRVTAAYPQTTAPVNLSTASFGWNFLLADETVTNTGPLIDQGVYQLAATPLPNGGHLLTARIIDQKTLDDLSPGVRGGIMFFDGKTTLSASVAPALLSSQDVVVALQNDGRRVTSQGITYALSKIQLAGTPYYLVTSTSYPTLNALQ